MHLKPNNKKYVKLSSINNLEKITRILFSNKRKMINKNIKKIFKDINKVKQIKNIDLNSRPSEISPEKFYELAKLFEKIQ